MSSRKQRGGFGYSGPRDWRDPRFRNSRRYFTKCKSQVFEKAEGIEGVPAAPHRKSPGASRAGVEFDLAQAEQACEGTGIEVAWDGETFVFTANGERLCSDQRWKFGLARAKMLM